MRGRFPTSSVPSHTATKRQDLPWGLVAPLGTPIDLDPTQLADAQRVAWYAVEENDLHFTVCYEPRAGRRRFFLAEQNDAVHVVVTIEPLPQRTDESGPWTREASGMLSAPLAGRPVIDGASGTPVRRFDSWPVGWPERPLPALPDPVSGAAPPLFVSTGLGALMLFASEDALTAALPGDFQALVPDYEAFDHRGLRLNLISSPVHPQDRPATTARLTVRAAESEPTQDARLRDLLAKTLNHPKVHPEGGRPATLESLVDYAGWAGECFRTPPSPRMMRLEQIAKRLSGRRR